ncbi:PhoH family protein [Candidatus Dependentiae bacterium]|nr:MAG: PhoH family protein [Candidatus Dependentiae bacterium]
MQKIFFETKDFMAIKKKVSSKIQKMHAQKLFILDTNVLVHDPHALESFEGVLVGIPLPVLEELDRFKHEGTDRGRNSREAIRFLDGLRQIGSLRDGVVLKNKATVRILFPPTVEKGIMPVLDGRATNDNDILLIAYAYEKNGFAVVFISKDLNARVKADSLGVATQDYQKESISSEDFYHGWTRMAIAANDLRASVPSALLAMTKELVPNQFVLLESNNNPHNYRVFRYLGNKKFKPVTDTQMRWPLKARNPEQAMALDLLTDPSIELVCLFGPAGTGKTFLALLAGLYKVLVDQEYEKMLVARPVIPLGRDIGYLPGTLEEKLYSWMLPIYDNVQFIAHATKIEQHVQHVEHDHRKDKQRNKKRHKEITSSQDYRPEVTLDELIKKNKISLEPITYMRGRSIPYQYIFVDEVQNLTPHEVKTLITRVGQGSKIVLAGDPYQIDSPYLDFPSNGLVNTSERFKGQEIFGSVFLKTSERSQLSELASKLL